VAPKHIVNMTDAERIAEYQRGWNDSARHNEPDCEATILYFIGYREQTRGDAPRFAQSVQQTLH
jgi:hypothetical protein